MKITPTLCNAFTRNFTYDSSRDQRRIGMEGEFPVVSRNGQAVDYPVIRGMFHYLRGQGFTLQVDNSTGEFISAKRLALHQTGATGYCMDVISTDTGYSIIEISPAPAENLLVLQQVFKELMQLLLTYFEKQDAWVLGYGIQPLTPPSSRMLAPKSRYLLFKQWSANRLIPSQLGHDCDLLTITASSQTHIDVNAHEAVAAVNVINGLAGLQIILHANSPVWNGKPDLVSKAVRESFWDHCFPARPDQVGIPERFADMEAYVRQLCGFRMQAVERDGSTVAITMSDSFLDFLTRESATGLTTDELDCTVTPQMEDLDHQAGFAWFNGRLVPKHGTVEARVYCQQPPGETLCSHALTLGLIENLSAATQLLDRFAWEDWRNLRKAAMQHGFDAQITRQPVIPLLEEMLDIAKAGLQKRGLQEECWLDSLYERLAMRQAPADRVIRYFDERGLPAMVEAFSFNSLWRQATC